MEEMQQITIDQWMSWKEDIREKLKETAGNFVYIGYRLKQIRDSGMYDGAADIFEFAGREYGLSKSTVSRFIAINEKFSEGGNSLELKAEYIAISSSKLAEMLTLTDAECSLITEKTTVSQIRELKNFNRQVPEEGEEPDGGERQDSKWTSLQWTPLQKCIIEYFRGKKGMLDAAMECIFGYDYKEASEIICPNGNTSFKKGLIFLFLYDYKEGVKYKMFGSPDITVMSWDDFILEIWNIFLLAYRMESDGYDAFYGAPEQEPEKVEETPERRNGSGSVATSQQEEKGAENHVEKMEDEEDPERGDEEDNEPPEKPEDKGEPGDDADGAGGDDGEVNTEAGEECGKEHSDNGNRCLDNEQQDIVEPVAAGVSDSGEGERIRGYKAGIKSALRIMQDRYEKQDWTGLIKKAKDVIWRAEQIQKNQKGEKSERWGKHVYL